MEPKNITYKYCRLASLSNVWAGQQMEIKDLLHDMQRKPMSLFCGAGVCMGCGGPSGDQLFHNIKQQYPSGNSQISSIT